MIDASQVAGRAPHAALDLQGRLPKAAKIRSLLPIGGSWDVPLRLLEVGTGSGAIASYFGSLASPEFDVEAVDVIDQRRISSGFRFRQVQGVDLPYEDASFDVVISNHVLEHVGGRSAQERHLAEIARVLSPRGVAYLATPNRWQVLEPHFRVPFLSWLPRRMRNPYLSAWRRRRVVYDCEPLGRGALERAIADAGLDFRNICVEAFHGLLANEKRPPVAVRMASLLPDALLWRLRSLCPTHVYLLAHGRSAL